MQKRFVYLLNRYRSHEASVIELEEFYKMLSSGVYDELFAKSVDHIYDDEDYSDALGNEETYYAKGARTRILQHVLEFGEHTTSSSSKRKLLKIWPRLAMVAASVVLMIFGVWFFTGNHNILKPDELTSRKQDVLPGGVGATLTLSNGKKIVLSAAVHGQLAKEGGVSITKTANGQLFYVIADKKLQDLNMAGTSNTLSTAKGQTFQLRLPDGSLVFLNAASSLTYTSSLLDKGKRVVKLQGEGYFEISKDKAHPFVVKTAKQEVEVLGTHFNINSYENEPTEKTTLLEGSVRITAGNNLETLKPGEQGKLEGNKLSIDKVDTDLAIAWKNNDFMFKSEPIDGVMRMVERWYNVEVVYIGDKTNEKFSGTVSRFDNVSSLLSIIESTGAAHFKIEGRKIYVSK
uniref:FecR family protein n=1 Tax=Pedobacter schmidteae TaxID=2201271 RepID=UPI000EB1225E|nr:FecR family protein [Pedobacter schmidteae]